MVARNGNEQTGRRSACLERCWGGDTLNFCNSDFSAVRLSNHGSVADIVADTTGFLQFQTHVHLLWTTLHKMIGL